MTCSKDSASADSAPDMPPGKARLIEAALRLCAERRSFSSLGIRELARAAGLNPNTFYRHFDSLEDLALEAVERITARLRPMLHSARESASHEDPAHAARRTCAAFFAFAAEHADAFLIGAAEFNGASPQFRVAMRRALADIAAELADDARRLRLLPPLPQPVLDELASHIVTQLFHLSIEYIEQPALRGQTLDRAERFIEWIVAGAEIRQAAP